MEAAAGWNQQMVGGGAVGFAVPGQGQLSMAEGQSPSLFQCQLCGSSALQSKRMLLTHLRECSERRIKVLFETNQCLQCRNAFLSQELLLVHINTCAAEQLEQVVQIEAMEAMRAAQIKQESAAVSRSNVTENRAGGVTAAKTERDDDDAVSSQGDAAESFYGDSESTAETILPKKSSSIKGDDDENPYPCAEQNCDKSFSSLNILKNHNDTAHLGKSNNQCGLCGKKFTTGHSMKMHDEAVHQGKKNYKCDSCGKSFSQPQHLKGHIEAVHRGKKDHKCNSCDKRFSGRGTLKQHDESVHQGIRHQCNLCEKSFSEKKNLNQHKKIEHPSSI